MGRGFKRYSYTQVEIAELGGVSQRSLQHLIRRGDLKVESLESVLVWLNDRLERNESVVSCPCCGRSLKLVG